nr:MAG TPA: hypothetical protein [Bacteriophage sp.]DAS32102.1 MAG TPA: hypothetical protein [Caudoviricetes sp.]
MPKIWNSLSSKRGSELLILAKMKNLKRCSKMQNPH